MFRCHVCSSTESREELVSEIFQIDGKPVLVENIPAQVCVRCGEEIFSREATEKVRLIVRGKKKPIKSVQMDVLLMPENEIPDMKISIGNFYSPKDLTGFHESTIHPRPCPCNHPNGLAPR